MHKRRVAEVLLDLCLIPLAYYSAYRLRFEGAQFAANLPALHASRCPVVSGRPDWSRCSSSACYRGIWRYFRMMDAIVVAPRASCVGTVDAELVVLYLLPIRRLLAVRVRDRRAIADAAC